MFYHSTSWALESLTVTRRSSIMSQYAAAGKYQVDNLRLRSSDAPNTTNSEPITSANTMAAWVKKYNLVLMWTMKHV